MAGAAGPDALVAALDLHTRRLALKPQAYGAVDCCLAVGEWVEEVTGVDVADGLRGTYATEMDWRRILVAEGGMVALFGRLLAPVGYVRAEVAEPGDVGVVVVPGLGETGAVMTPRGWRVKIRSGITVGQFEAVAVWRLP